MRFTASDHAFMARALLLAQRGLNTTTPNPRVGCVIVRNGRIAGEGWHQQAGGPHAEVNALAAAGEAARGATVYLNLEPCSHHGRTPPCAEALIGAGVAKVIAALQDPNPLVAGQGFAKLRAAGIDTECGLLAAEARELNLGFVARMERGRPWLRCKLAASLDGKTALNNGASQWITGAAARRDAHLLRARSCALLTGIGTVRDDDPALTVRLEEPVRQPVRVVIDSRLDIPLGSRVLQGGGTLIATVCSDAAKIAALTELGAEVLLVPEQAGKTDLAAVLRLLAERGMNEITVEAGAKLNGSLLQAGLIDELVLYQAPSLLGDQARGLFALPALTTLEGRTDWSIQDVRPVGHDLRLVLRPLR